MPSATDGDADLAAARHAKSIMSLRIADYGNPADELWRTHPNLARFLFRKSWNGITPRETASLSITASPIGLVVTCRMPSEANSCSEPVSRFCDVLDALERMLRDRTGQWKELKNGPGAQKLREERKKLLEKQKGEI